MKKTHEQGDIFSPDTMSTKAATFWSGLHGGAQALAIANYYRQQENPLLIIVENTRQAEYLKDELTFFLGSLSDELFLFSDWECLPYDQFSPHQDIISDRLAVLSRLPSAKRAIVIITVANLMQRLPPLSYIIDNSFNLKTNDHLDVNQFREKLINAAYVNVSQVLSPGEYALRGGIIDVYPMGSTAPIRIDLFDDEIDSLSYFDPTSQRTTIKTTSIEILPGKEFPLNETGVSQFRSAFRRVFSGDAKTQTVYNDISNFHASPGIEYYLPLFFNETATLFDYLPENTIIFRHSNTHEISENCWANINDRYSRLSHDPNRKILPVDYLYLNPSQTLNNIKSNHNIIIHFNDANKSAIKFASIAPPTLKVESKSDTPYYNLIQHLDNNREIKTLITVESAGRFELMANLLEQNNFASRLTDNWQQFLENDDRLAIAISPVERGLNLPTNKLQIISESQIYGERTFSKNKSVSGYDPETIIRSLAELNIGDPVTHETHGIGRYLGLKTIEYDNTHTEFMVIEYADEAKLYVPVLSLHLISRYASGSTDNVPLHRLGSDVWEKIKKKAKAKAYDVAVELLEIQAIRTSRTGYEFNIPQSELDLFAASFDHSETPDQQRSIDEIIADMNSSKPMDRLVCGDVGFGKTEVAIRAAMVAVLNNKQVAVLVPTTLLAQQHFETFKERFSHHAVQIELLSRFRTKSQINETIMAVAQGKVDIVLGTHRLLQSDIKFNRLGLLILDEEHRFGVRQKERLKKLREEVDILTLTATPIPRTLNLTLSKMRDISIISTPPKDRLSIQTFVREKTDVLIQEAIEREVRRGGQIYYLHNEVKTIEQKARHIQSLMPGIKIGIGHGQMPENQLESIMQNFYHRRFEVFICTTIVESGIDNPAANTIIIDKANRFGLAQLHQLRGRVGRSHHQAYAYLLVDDFKLITPDAKKRLDAIASLKELGAGFALASHDLEIRGAGELLGEAQSGSIDDVGFNLYTQYLSNAINSLKQNHDSDKIIESTHNTEIDITVPAILPESYLPDVHMRLVFYKRIASAVNDKELFELKVELADRFGILPDTVKLLLELAKLRLHANSLGVTNIKLNENGGFIDFIEKPNFDPIKILSLIQQHHDVYKLQGNARLTIIKSMKTQDERLQAIASLIDQLKD